MGNPADLRTGDVTALPSAVAVELTSTPVLGYALAHNRVPVVHRMALTATGGSVRGGPERADAIVAAVAEAVRRHGIRHSEPPASWIEVGQQVRSPGDVLTWRVGTPLDLVVLLAAALEQAGLRPLLWLAEGHSFLGYW